MTLSFSCFRGAATLVDQCAKVREGEDVLVVTDYERVQVGEVVVQVAVSRRANVSLMVMPPRSAPGVEPPRNVAHAMAASDVVFQPVARSIAHTQATKRAREAGARVIVMADFTLDMLKGGGLDADFVAQKPICEDLAARLSRAKMARVWSASGTDITMVLEGRAGRALTGLAWEPGSYAAPPNIEASIAPVEYTAEGTIVVDASIGSVGLVCEPVVLKVERGRVVEVRGGKEASALERLLAGAGDPNVYFVGELGVGLNPCCQPKGSLLEDEGCFGCVHIALGNNANFGGQIRAQLHVDNILWKPTLELDGVPVLDKGVLV